MIRLWLVKGDQPILNERGVGMLRAVWDHGSVDGAASGLHISSDDLITRLDAMAETVGGPLYHVDSEGGDKLSLTPEGEMLLTEYETKLKLTQRFLKYGTWPPITADGILYTEKGILLINRGNEPFQGYWALPGGFLDMGETIEDTLVREMKEETGLDVEIVKVVGVFSRPDRDPRGQTVSTAFHVKLKDENQEPVAGDDAADFRFFSLDELPKLAFDHEEIIQKWRDQEGL